MGATTDMAAGATTNHHISNSHYTYGNNKVMPLQVVKKQTPVFENHRTP
jgi:hypothetical protein